MNERVGRQADGRTSGWEGERVGGRVGGRTSRWADERMSGRPGGRMSGWVDKRVGRWARADNHMGARVDERDGGQTGGVDGWHHSSLRVMIAEKGW